MSSSNTAQSPVEESANTAAAVDNLEAPNGHVASHATGAPSGAPAPSAPRPVIAVIGGGQLARMMQESAIALGIDLHALVEAEDGATGSVVVHSVVGDPSDIDAVRTIISGADVLTFEHEHVPQDILRQVGSDIAINPPASALLYAQDKLAMRERLTDAGIPCPRWAKVTTPEELAAFGDAVGWPVIVKTPVGGYDGHGVRVVSDAHGVDDWFDRGAPLLAEEKVSFTVELAALVARNPSGQVRSWPVAQTIQHNGVCSIVRVPAPGISAELARQAEDLGERIAVELGVTGVLAVELFVADGVDGARVLVNELAMRPHNSGHWTIDGSVTSQFEQHLRAVLDLPLGSTRMTAPATVMVNLLGSNRHDPSEGLSQALATSPEAKIHLYGKSVRPGRKLGHVNVSATTVEEAQAAAQAAVDALFGEPEEEDG